MQDILDNKVICEIEYNELFAIQEYKSEGLKRIAFIEDAVAKLNAALKSTEQN